MPPGGAKEYTMSETATLHIIPREIVLSGLLSWTACQPLSVTGPISLSTRTALENLALHAGLDVRMTAPLEPGGGPTPPPISFAFELKMQHSEPTMAFRQDIQVSMLALQ